MVLRIHRMLLPLLSLALLAVPARAGDPLSGAFRKQSKSAVKAVSAQAAASLKAVKSGVKAQLAAYVLGQASATEAAAGAASVVTAQRDLLEDGATAAMSTLQAGGVELLAGFAGSLPPADFRAGGGGAWDDALDGIEAILDRTDARLAAECLKLAKSLRKGAAVQGQACDMRCVVPPHGIAFRGILPPFVPSSLAGDSLPLEPPQVLIAVRLVETSQSDRLELGVRYAGGMLAVTGASTDAEAAALGDLTPGPDGTATGGFDLTGLEDPASWLRVDLAAGLDFANPVFLSAPGLVAPAQGLSPIATGFKQDLAAARKDFGADGGAALKLLRVTLGSHLKAVKSGQATVELALRTGFSNLATARESLGDGYRAALGQAVDQAGAALANAGLGNADLSPDFAPDTPGVYGDAAAKLGGQWDALQAKSGAAYAGFVGKALKLAAKQGEAVGAAFAGGNTGRLQPPLLSDAAGPPAALQSPALLTDALVLVTQSGPSPEYDVNLLAQTDPTAAASLQATGEDLPNLTPLALGGLLADDGGTAKATGVPLLGELPVLGWLFRAGPDAGSQRSLVVLVKPSLVNGSGLD